MQTIAPGYEIDEKFKILSQLGMGGLGTVYKAEQIDLGRVVAIKILHDNILDGDEMSLRFEREAKVLANLKHPNIVDVFAFGSLGPSIPYMAMEFVDGKSLDVLLKTESEDFGWKRVLKIAVQVCEGFAFAHSKGIIHRDIKPQNIMVEKSTNGDLAKILDFGLSRVLDERESIQHLTATGTLIGSVHYMSPELCLGRKADERSDIYALACTLYQCLGGKPPLDSESPMSVINMHVNEMPKLLRESGSLRAAKIPVELDLAVLKALQKDPDDRYQSMREFSTALTAILEGRTEDLDLKELEKLSGRGTKRNKLLLSLILVVVGSIAIFAFVVANYHKNIASRNPITTVRESLQDKAESYLKEGKKLRQAGHDHEAEVYARRAMITIAKPFPSNLQSAKYTERDLSIIVQAAGILSGFKRPRADLSAKVFDTISDNNKAYLSTAQLMPYYKSLAIFKSLYLSAHDSSADLFNALHFCLPLKDIKDSSEILAQYALSARNEETQDEAMRQCYLEVGRAYISAMRSDKKGVSEHTRRAMQISSERKVADNNSLSFLRELGRLHTDLHDYEQAEKELLLAFPIAAKCEGAYKGLTNEVGLQLARVYQEQGDSEKAAAVLKKAKLIEATAKRGPDVLHAVLDEEGKRLKVKN